MPARHEGRSYVALVTNARASIVSPEMVLIHTSTSSLLGPPLRFPVGDGRLFQMKGGEAIRRIGNQTLRGVELEVDIIEVCGDHPWIGFCSFIGHERAHRSMRRSPQACRANLSTLRILIESS